MRVNVYAEEMTNRIEIIEKEAEGRTFTGLRFYLELPVTNPETISCIPCNGSGENEQGNYCKHCKGHGYTFTFTKGPFLHSPGDDDSSAVTFWGKTDLRKTLKLALSLLDNYYASRQSRS